MVNLIIQIEDQVFFGKKDSNHPIKSQKQIAFQFEKIFKEGIIGNNLGNNDNNIPKATI